MKALLVMLLLAVASCNTEIQEIQEPELEFDVSGLIKCITEVAPLVPDVIEIINYIKAADWAQAATKIFDAIAKLVPVAKGCINAFKKEINLEKIRFKPKKWFNKAKKALCLIRCASQPTPVLKGLCAALCLK